MFFHLLSGRLKCLLRNRTLIFWTLLFPIVLGTLFYFAFGSIIEKSEAFSTIPMAVVDNEAYSHNDWMQQAFKEVSRGDDRIFDLTEGTEEEAKQLLDEGKIDGYLIPGEQWKLVVKQSGINQSILKAFADELVQTQKTVEHILTENPQAMTGVLESLGRRDTYIQEISPTGKNPDTTLNYFYALIAMACLYGSFWGLQVVTDLQGNLSALGARRGIAPTHKLKAVLADFSAAILLQFTILMVVIGYLAFVLQVNFGEKVGYVLLTCLVGSIVGISFGGFLSALIKKGEGVKVAILITVSMVLSFLSGLMYGEMKDIIARSAPVLSYINPASLISDSFYSLYFFESLTRYVTNTSILCGMAVLLSGATYYLVRRQKYASI